MGQVQFLLDKYSNFEPTQSINAYKLYGECWNYQSLCHNDIPDEIWNEAKVRDRKTGDKHEIFHNRMDELWLYLFNLLGTETNIKRFKHLIKVAEIV